VEKVEWDAAFRFYAQVVQDYSWKLLTYPEDVVAPFSGIAATLEQHSGWTITHGLAEQFFDWALLWVPLGQTKRRPPPRSSLISPFPSWPWVGWVGPVSYNLAYIDALVDLKTFVTDWEIEEAYTPIHSSINTEEKAPDPGLIFRKILRRLCSDTSLGHTSVLRPARQATIITPLKLFRDELGDRADF